MKLFFPIRVSCFTESFVEFNFYHIELESAGIIQGFDFCLIFLLDGFSRGQCLSNKFSTLLKKSGKDRCGFSEERFFAGLFQMTLDQNREMILFLLIRVIGCLWDDQQRHEIV